MKQEELFTLIGEVDDKLAEDAYRPSPPTRKIQWLKWGAAAACLCLVLAAVLLPHSAPFADAVDPQKDNPAGPANSGAGSADQTAINHFVVNPIENSTALDLDVTFTYYSDLSQPEQDHMLDAFQRAAAIDYDSFLSRIPKQFLLQSFYAVNAPSVAAPKEYRPHDYVLVYQTQAGGQASISLSPLEPPLRCYFSMDDAPQKSEVNGVPVVICGSSSNDFFTASFTHEGIYYDIETEHLSLTALEDLLVSILTDSAEAKP